jgi:AbrB family looped-hinge helix DNA binding protein
MKTGILSTKGWVVIPQELRERYRLKKGDRVHFIDYGGVVAIVPVSKHPLTDAAGMLKGGVSLTQTLMNSRRKERSRNK